MKLGQSLSIELGDLFPPEVAEILARLHDQAQEMPFVEVEAILRRELGSKAREIRDLSPKAFAAASIGQVHRAVYQGEAIALKVQFPGIDRSVDSDIAMLGRILRGSALLLARKVDFTELLEELKEVLHQETDYTREAELLATYQRNLKGFEGIRIPRVFPEISTRHVLAMGFEEGLRLTDWMKTAPSLEARVHFADLILRLYIDEFYRHGLVQTDPNFGNFLFRGRTLVLLDFGATRSYSVDFRLKYHEFLGEVRESRWERVREIAFDLGLIEPSEGPDALAAFERLLKVSFEPFEKNRFDFADSDYAMRVRQASRDLVRALRYSAPPKALIFLHRKLGGVFHMLRTLQVEMNLASYLDHIDAVAREIRSR